MFCFENIDETESKIHWNNNRRVYLWNSKLNLIFKNEMFLLQGKNFEEKKTNKLNNQFDEYFAE